MHRTGLAVLLLGTVISSPAFALDQCTPSRDDPLIRVCAYKPTQRFQVTGIIGNPVTLTFGPSESIKRFAWAYSSVNDKGQPVPTWRGPKIKGDGADGGGMPGDAFINNLPIWPEAPGTSSVTVITTTKDGGERSYQFALTARKMADDCNADRAGAGCVGDALTTDGLQFTYPAEVSAAAVAAWQTKQVAVKAKMAADRLKVDPLYGPRNFSYEAHGKKDFASLQPSAVSDNGWLTTMRWPGNIQPPRIYILDPKTGSEQIAPTTVRSDGITVVNTTSEWFRLRLGDKSVLDLHNLAWNPNRPDPATGTTSPDVVRTVISADSNHAQ
jgi:type IV secretion system protein VirB9